MPNHWVYFVSDTMTYWWSFNLIHNMSFHFEGKQSLRFLFKKGISSIGVWIVIGSILLGDIGIVTIAKCQNTMRSDLGKINNKPPGQSCHVCFVVSFNLIKSFL